MMHPESRSIIGQILAPAGGPAPEAGTQSPPMSFDQIITPRGVYTGVERRAQGALVAEVTPPGTQPARPPAG